MFVQSKNDVRHSLSMYFIMIPCYIYYMLVPAHGSNLLTYIIIRVTVVILTIVCKHLYNDVYGNTYEQVNRKIELRTSLYRMDYLYGQKK